MQVQKGPKTPRFVQLMQWVFAPLTFMEENANSYGDAFEARLARNITFLSGPKAVQAIFTARPEQFDRNAGKYLLQPLLGNNSLLTLDGDRHQRHRQLLMPSFHAERMHAYGKLICDLTLEITKKWIPDEPFIARDSARDISLLVILKAVFGLSKGKRYERLKQLLSEALDSLSSPWQASAIFFKQLQIDLGPWSPWGQFLRRRQEIDKLLQLEISDRRSSLDPEARDILTMMLLAKDAEGETMTDEECKDELLTLLFAGQDTTATAIAWSLYWTHKLPEVRSKLLEELATLGDNPEPMAIVKLPYLNAVCNETLRIYPVGIIASPRTAKEAVTIDGQKYDAGTNLVPCMYLVHRRQDLYPEPEKFKPERFLERQYSPYEFFPFGGGNRRCIGAALAIFEMKLVLATILLNHNLALVEKGPVKAVRRGINLAPAGGVKMVVQ